MPLDMQETDETPQRRGPALHVGCVRTQTIFGLDQYVVHLRLPVSCSPASARSPSSPAAAASSAPSSAPSSSRSRTPASPKTSTPTLTTGSAQRGTWIASSAGLAQCTLGGEGGGVVQGLGCMGGPAWPTTSWQSHLTGVRAGGLRTMSDERKGFLTGVEPGVTALRGESGCREERLMAVMTFEQGRRAREGLACL